MIFERIAVGTAALSWWIFCEYLRTKTVKPVTAKLLSFAGFGGGFALILLALLF